MKRNFTIFPKQFGLFPYIFLVYLLFPIYYVTKESGLKQLIGAGMVVLFLLSYRQLYATIGKSSYTYWLALQLSIVFVFTLFFNMNYMFLGFFPANFIGWYKDQKKFYRGLFFLAIVIFGTFLYQVSQGKVELSASQLLYFVPFMIIMMFSPFGVRSMNRRMELERKLDQANQQIEELVKREERVRIARDLHDTLGHTLSLLTLKSQLVQRLTTADPERAKLEAKEMEVTSRAALKQVRELVTDMRAATIAEELLQVQQILRAAGITYEYNGEVDFSKIPPFTQNVISMCLKEAATNIVKHSKATHCDIRIDMTHNQLKVMVQDDGMGVDQNKLFGNGLKGMVERLSLIDGTLSMDNHHGAVLNITVPIIKKEGSAG